MQCNEEKGILPITPNKKIAQRVFVCLDLYPIAFSVSNFLFSPGLMHVLQLIARKERARTRDWWAYSLPRVSLFTGFYLILTNVVSNTSANFGQVGTKARQNEFWKFGGL